MDFDLSDDQKALAGSVRDALAASAPDERLRAMVDDGGRMPTELWDEMSALGWTALLVPERHCGLGLGLVDAAVVLEETGRLPLPGPYFSSAVLATLAANRLGATALLPELTTGDARGTLALEEAGTADDPLDAVRTTATRTGDGRFLLDGLKPMVLDGADADWVIVVARDDEGLAGFLVERPAAEAVPGLDPTRALARLELVSTPAARLGTDGDQTALLRRVLDDASVGLAAELVGCCERALELATEYARQRVQFGRPIGSFQAIKHMAADMLAELTLARVATYYAAWASDTDAPDREAAVAMAKSWAAEGAVRVTGECIQIHGGVGFTWECDAHLLYKRAKANDLLLGRQGWQRSRLADLLLGPPQPHETV